MRLAKLWSKSAMLSRRETLKLSGAAALGLLATKEGGQLAKSPGHN